ncbi:MAG: DUF971 domain-containing protein [Planctomycetia bacterium]
MQNPPRGLKLRRDERLLEIEWSLGSAVFYYARRLRLACRCAACIDENTGAPLLDPAVVPPDVGLVSAKLVGNYAIKLTFSDGHDTGLYTWEHLFELDPDPA